MKILEAFTLGKRFGHPEANEDSLVVIPDIGYAVIDGVTDRNGTRYRNMLAGRFASRTAAKTITRILLGLGDTASVYEGPGSFVAHLTEAVADGYREKGLYDRAMTDTSIRAGCAVAACFVDGDALQIISVGDSGIRINGATVMQGLKPLDDVTSRLRRETWRYFEALGRSADECDRLAASVTWHGTRNQPADLPTASSNAREEIEARALKVNIEALPNVPQWEILELIHHGIVNGQGKFQNVDDRALAYGVIDGFPVPTKFIDTARIPVAEVETIELFSDGYFSPGAAFGVAAWETEFERVERDDPYKIGRYMSTKGTTDVSLTDDRTYLGVRLK